MNAFSPEQIFIVNQAAAMAEELVSNHYKMSLTEWKRPRYDFKPWLILIPLKLLTDHWPRSSGTRANPNTLS